MATAYGDSSSGTETPQARLSFCFSLPEFKRNPTACSAPWHRSEARTATPVKTKGRMTSVQKLRHEGEDRIRRSSPRALSTRNRCEDLSPGGFSVQRTRHFRYSTCREGANRRGDGSIHHLHHGVGGHVFCLFRKRQAIVLLVKIDADQIAAAHLLGRDQVRQRMHQVAIDGTLQVAGAILQIGTLAKQVILGAIGKREYERCAVGRGEDALLHDVQFKRQNLTQLCNTEGLEHHRLVDAVHELGGELLACRIDAGASDLVSSLVVHHAGGMAPLDLTSAEAQTRPQDRTHLGRTQVAGHENERAREVYRRLSPSVSVALSKIPSSRFHSASLAFSISSNSTKLSLIRSVWYWFSTSWLSNGCVSRCPR